MIETPVLVSRTGWPSASRELTFLNTLSAPVCKTLCLGLFLHAFLRRYLPFGVSAVIILILQGHGVNPTELLLPFVSQDVLQRKLEPHVTCESVGERHGSFHPAGGSPRGHHNMRSV